MFVVRWCAPLVVAVVLLAFNCHAADNVVVVLDDSGSMSDSMGTDASLRRIDAAKLALETVLQQLPEDSRIGILALNGVDERTQWIIPLGPIDRSAIQQAIGQIVAAGGTPLGEALKVAADELLQTRAKEHYGTYRLLVVTDGEANEPEYLNAILPDVLARGLTVDVIGVDMQTTHSLATKVHSYRRADDPASLTAAISAVFAESQADAGTSDDTGQSDFDMLAGLPDEVAQTALQALAESGNRPIEPVPAELAFSSPDDGGFPYRSGRSVLKGFLVVCFGAVMVVILLLAKLSGNRRRR